MNVLDPTAFAGVLLLANVVCMVLVAVNLQADTKVTYRDGCNECRQAQRGEHAAELERRRREIELIQQERERRKKEIEDNDHFHWR